MSKDDVLLACGVPDGYRYQSVTMQGFDTCSAPAYRYGDVFLLFRCDGKAGSTQHATIERGLAKPDEEFLCSQIEQRIDEAAAIVELASEYPSASCLQTLLHSDSRRMGRAIEKARAILAMQKKR